MESCFTWRRVIRRPLYYCLLIGLLLSGLAEFTSGSNLDAARLELETARENLRISQASEARIASDLEQLKESGNASPDLLMDYETYLARLRAMVMENDKVVREMEKAYVRRVPGHSASNSPDSSRAHDMLEPGIPEDEVVDEITALDSEFNESLATFDEMLLQELKRIRLKSAPRMSKLTSEAAAAAERLREKGVALNTSSLEKTPTVGERTEQEGETKAGDANKKMQSGDSEKGKEAQERGEGNQSQGYGGGDGSAAGTTVHGQHEEDVESGEASTRKQGDRRSGGHDDDIVARQLREAAEKETDPELKEKLWKEYEDYKDSNR